VTRKARYTRLTHVPAQVGQPLAYVTKSTRRAIRAVVGRDSTTLQRPNNHYVVRCYQPLAAHVNDNGHVSIGSLARLLDHYTKDLTKAYQIELTINLHYQSLGLISYSTLEQ